MGDDNRICFQCIYIRICSEGNKGHSHHSEYENSIYNGYVRYSLRHFIFKVAATRRLTHCHHGVYHRYKEEC